MRTTHKEILAAHADTIDNAIADAVSEMVTDLFGELGLDEHTEGANPYDNTMELCEELQNAIQLRMAAYVAAHLVREMKVIADHPVA